MRTLVAAGIATVLFLVLLVGDMVLRAMISGRMDAFFTSLAAFSMDFAAIMLFGYIIQRHVLRRHPGAPSRALLAFIVLVMVSFCAGYVRLAVRSVVIDHVETVVAGRLVDKSMIPICNALARELIDVEVFRYAAAGTAEGGRAGWGERLVGRCDLMSQLNGNSRRRELYVRILTSNHMLREDTSLQPDDLMLSREELGPYFMLALVLALLSIGVFIWAVIEVVRSLQEVEEVPLLPANTVSPGGER